MEFDTVTARELRDWLTERKYEETVVKKETSFTDKVYQASCRVLVDELNVRFEGRAIVSYELDAYGFHYIVARRFKSLKRVWGMQVDWGVMDKMLTFNTYPDMVAKKIQEALL